MPKKYKKSELRKLLEEAFEHYKQQTLYKEEIHQYFKNKGINEKEIDELIEEAFYQDILDIGIVPISDPKDPLKIIEGKRVYILKRKEKWKKIS
ncbi:MAG: hypothetical protein NDF54_05325 [archaeon GB-1867-035]|nr:hypothetical protein [Candidatus Culexmicrobium profundum]